MSQQERDFLTELLAGHSLTEEELNKRQWQILEAAIKVFSEKGFEASRTSEIAKTAQVAEGTIFRYYRTKKDLLLGLLMPLMVNFFRPMLFLSIERIMENQEDKPLEEVFKQLYLDRLALVRKNFPLIKTVLIESSYHPELLQPLQEEIGPKITPMVDEFMRANVDSGVFRQLDPRLLTRTTVSLMLGYVILSSTLPNLFAGDDDAEEIEKMVDILFHGIINQEEDKGIS